MDEEHTTSTLHLQGEQPENVRETTSVVDRAQLEEIVTDILGDIHGQPKDAKYTVSLRHSENDQTIALVVVPHI